MLYLVILYHRSKTKYKKVGVESMLDDANVIKQRDKSDALGIAARQYEQVDFVIQLEEIENDGRPLKNVVIAGVGGSALASEVAKTLLASELSVPLEVIKGYDLPGYVSHDTLVIVSSNSGNTEETLSCLEQALKRDAQVAAVATGGKLMEIAREKHIMLAPFPHNGQPRMGLIYNLRAMLAILVQFGLVRQRVLEDMAMTRAWLEQQTEQWTKDVPLEKNYAKQLALQAVGKTAEFVGGALTASIAYKWKISWNENGKNVSFCNNIPEYNHNEFMGWTSHPIEKPFIIFDLRSDLEHPRIQKRFDLTNKLLSGKRPKSHSIWLKGDTLIEQLLWGCVLADFASIYLGILNNVDPTQVDLITKLKQELV